MMNLKKNVIAIAVGVCGAIMPCALMTAGQASADPCQFNQGVPNWANPCYAVAPPWNSPGWSPQTGKPGTWGPNGMYTPCDKPSGFCY